MTGRRRLSATVFITMTLAACLASWVVVANIAGLTTAAAGGVTFAHTGSGVTNLTLFTGM